MIKTIIIDDELKAISNLKWEIENYCPGLEVIETFTNPIEAISAINYLKPDCVFLDIKMPEMDGFTLLKNLRYRKFNLVVTSAHESFALMAFKENAIDYLLKPIDSEDLIRVVSKIKNNKLRNALGIELNKVLNSHLSLNNDHNKIQIPLDGKIVFVNAENIMYCKSEGNYTTVYLKDKSTYLMVKSMKKTCELIPNKYFLRVHQSYLVNLKYVKELYKNNESYLVLTTGTTIPVSRSNKKALLELMNQL